MQNTDTQLPEGLRVPILEIEGLTPAQQALAAHRAPPSVIPECEQRLYDVFALVERHIHPDVSGRYGALLQDIAEDQTYQEVTYYGLIRAPACLNDLRFADEGGLVRLLLARWDAWEAIRDAGAAAEPLLEDVDVTDGNVLQALIHDALPRAWAHYVPGPYGSFAAQGEHESITMFNPSGKTILLLQQSTILLDGPLLHVLFHRRFGPRSPLLRVLGKTREASCLPEFGA